MLGSIVNFAAIIVGGTLGLLFKKGLSEKLAKTVMAGLALSVLLVGILSAIKAGNVLYVIIAIVIGAIVGELADFEALLTRFSLFVEAKAGKSDSGLSQGFVTASLLFCVGSMAILGSLDAGLKGNYDVLFAKSVLDGIFSLIFASTLGAGVLFSAFPVLIYQGSITLLAVFVKDLLPLSVVADMTGVGGLLLIGLGLNMLELTKIKVANFLPALFIPVLIPFIVSLFQH